MRIDFVTLFPEMVLGALGHSIMSRAKVSGVAEFHATNPRDFTNDPHRTVDDHAYGGGPGMVMMVPPIAAALDSINPVPGSRFPFPIVLTDPAGRLFTQKDARALSEQPRIVIVCGHYEGVDERVRTQLCTHVYTIGDYVLTGGELPALVIADSIVRLLPGAIGDPASHLDDSHEGGLLGHPLYTRPPEFRGERVPDVLLGGNHKEIEAWRRRQSLQRTREARPDLFAGAKLTSEDVDLLG